MKAEEIFPYFHPTSIVVVDDDASFLESFAFRFGDKWMCEPFTDPKQALEFLHLRDNERQKARKFISPADGVTADVGLHPDGELVGFHSSEISSMMSEPERFSQVSVVLVDFDMPSMTGLELCEQLTGLPVRKVLLTGKAGEDVAINAFNASLIDGYVKKQSDNLSDELGEQVQRLQFEYFAGTTSPISSIHAVGGAPYLADPVFRVMLKRLIKQLDIVEYYALSNPCGIYLGHRTGASSFLRVMDEAEHQAQHEIAQMQDAPKELLSALEDGAVVPCFAAASGYYDKKVRDDWRSQVFPSNYLHGRATWRYSVIDAGRIDRDIVRNVVSWFDFQHKKKH